MSTPSFFHWYDVPPVAVKVRKPPGQMDSLVGLILPEGLVRDTTTEFDAGPEQVLPTIVTVYVPAAVAL